MCGRYSLGRTDRLDWGRFGVAAISGLVPRWNITPGTDVLAVREGADGRETALLRWGLIPHWAKDPAIGHRLVNARTETAHEKPSFREAFRSRRCLLPADGFYEWQAVPGVRRKQPWRIEAATGEPIALGALWEFWRDPAGQRVDTCTVLTVPVSRALAHIHDRLPLILDPHDWARWLSPRTAPDGARSLCHSAPEALLTAWQISERVNDVSNDDEEIVRQLDE